jgi:hypothetical protein
VSFKSIAVEERFLSAAIAGRRAPLLCAVFRSMTALRLDAAYVARIHPRRLLKAAPSKAPQKRRALDSDAVRSGRLDERNRPIGAALRARN